MAKRILALLSVLTMVFGLCAGCGTGGAGGWGRPAGREGRARYSCT